MTSKLTVFPDTNLFLQCKPLEELDWNLIGHADDVDVLITRPVQSELDALKANGNTRQASRSRTASSLLAQLLHAPEDGLVLRRQPTVRLKIALGLRPDPSVTEQLNYDHKDDQLVGIALGFQKSNPQESVSLVTYDNGPMFSARSVGLPFKQLPEEWLLPPELNDAAKREAALRKELERLQNSEPKFEIRLENATERAYELTYKIFEPLSAGEEEKLLGMVFERNPEATDFGPKEPSETVIVQNVLAKAINGEIKEAFTPATTEQIETYKTRYVEWREKCRSFLRDVHDQLNKRLPLPTIMPLIKNIGSRPADDALVELCAEGNFKIARINTDKNVDDLEKDETDTLLAFPRPPIAPQGVRKRIKSRSLFTDSVDASIRHQRFLETIPSFRSGPATKDPNAFYWQRGLRDEVPVTKLSLTCEQWRHAREAEDFTVGLRFQQELGIHCGRLTVSVHAANLSNPATKSWSVKISVLNTSPLEEVEKLILELSTPTSTIQLGRF